MIAGREDRRPVEPPEDHAPGQDAACNAEELFSRHLDLADRLARRYSHGPGIDDDLRQVARLGLHLASQRFQADKGVFVRFATVTVIGELKKHLRNHGWSVHVTRGLQEDSITVAAATERLTARLGRSPLVNEVAEHAGFSTERVVEALRVREVRFSEPAEHLAELVPGRSDPADDAIIALALAALPDDERALISMRFEHGMTQSEIGEQIGLSQPQVHRRLSRAVERLRNELKETLDDD